MDNDTRLNRLFAEYREAVPDPEPSASFVPGLWERIEAQRQTNRWFTRFAQGLVTAAAALSLLLALVLIPRSRNLDVYERTYVDVLADADALETSAYAVVLPAPAQPYDDPNR
jgi:hypothetical protein